MKTCGSCGRDIKVTGSAKKLLPYQLHCRNCVGERPICAVSIDEIIAHRRGEIENA